MLKNKWQKIGFIILVIVISIVLGLFITYNVLLGKVSNDNTVIDFNISYNTSSREVLENLKEAGLIKNIFVTKIYMKLNHVNNIQAGVYELNKTMSTKEILNKLSTGKVVSDEVTVTFVEGKRIPYYVSVIANNFNISEEEINATLNDKEFLKELINKYWFISDDILNKDIYYPLEGYFFPDTYNFKKDATVRDIVMTLINGLDTKLRDYKETILNSGYSAHEILTLASIVELEGVNDESRNGVASVFYNRLRSGWTLGSDVTTYYAFKTDFSQELTLDQYNTCNPYNTRSSCFSGLPVGPICSSGLESIKAVVKPVTSDYYYFVADKNKKTYYAKTSAEFNQIINELKKNNLWYTY